MEERAFDEGAKWWDATYAIRPNGMVTAQLIIFRTKNGYDKYKYDELWGMKIDYVDVEEHVLELGKLIVDKYEEKYHLNCNLGELGGV